jgi:hypothetical protein
MDRTSGGDDGVSWIRHRSGSLVNPAGERKASASGSHPRGNCVVVQVLQEANPRA